MLQIPLTQIDKFDQLIQDYPESAAKLKVMQLLSKVKKHLKLPAFMQNNELLEVQVTELIFLTALMNIFSLSLSTAGAANNAETVGKAFAILNSLFNLLPCTISFLVADKRQRMLNFKKLAINFLKMSSFYGAVYPMFYSLINKNETGVTAQFALVRSLTQAAGTTVIVHKAADIVELILKKLIRLDDDTRGYHEFWVDPTKQTQNATFKQTYLEFSKSFTNVMFLYFVLFIGMLLFMASMPNDVDILGELGLTNKPFAINNILNPMLLTVSMLLNYTYSCLTRGDN